MRAILIRSILVVAFLFGTVGLSSASAGNPFGDETSTVDGYPTWDSDLINLEAVQETDDITVGDHDSLWLPCGSGGVHDVSQILAAPRPMHEER